MHVTTINVYSLVEYFDGINVKEEHKITFLSDIKIESNSLCRVHNVDGKKSFIYPVEVKYGYKGVSDDEAIYVSDYVPNFKFMEKSEEARDFLKCSDEEFVMFVLKYGQDFPQG